MTEYDELVGLESSVVEELPCEHPDHDPSHEFHDDGPGTHYVRLSCKTCKWVMVQLLCATMISGYRLLLNEKPKSKYPYCSNCNIPVIIDEVIDMIEPRHKKAA